MLKTSVLVVTLQSDFGAFIRDGLDPSQFDSYITSEFSEAVHYQRESNCSMVLLDARLEDQELSVMDIGYGLRQLKPDTRFIVVVQPGQDVDADSLSPLATLSMPVSLNELSRLLKGPVGTPAARKAASAPVPDGKPAAPVVDAGATRLIWLGDVSKAAQHLTQLTLEASAQAAFITHQNDLWAYAGQLSREAAEELNDTVKHYADPSGQSDLLRFVRLKSTSAQHMLYARKINEDMFLAMVFDAETPFSTIRLQAGKLVKNLFDESAAPAPAQPKADPNLTTSFAPEDNDEMGDFKELPPISDVLGEVPPPIPQRSALTSALPWEKPGTEKRPVSQPVRPLVPPQPNKPTARPNSPVNHSDEAPGKLSTPPQSTPSTAETVVQTPRSPMRRAELDVTRKQDGPFDPESIAETRIQSGSDNVSDTGHRILIESPSMAQVNLSYACLLVPRLEQHYLVGDVEARLKEWMPQFCVAFGWRLELLSVRPDYMQWIVRVHLNTAAGYVIKVIRQHTSNRMFAEFPRLKQDNPSGEFWAHGFLVHGGAQSFPQPSIREFIASTRRRQGLR